jgi:hypothetical protein
LDGGVERERPSGRPASRTTVNIYYVPIVSSESPFYGEGYRKVWARLRYQGIRTSKERVRRLMRQHGLQAPQRIGHPHGPKAHDGTIITGRPDQMWGTVRRFIIR